MINFNKAPGQKILEVGCGDNPHPASDVRIDVRPGAKVDKVVNIEDENWPLQTNEFDGVYSAFCLEHVGWRKVSNTIKELFRVLKPGGRLILTIPNTEAQMRFILAKSEWDGDEGSMIFGGQLYSDDTHKSAWSPLSTTKLLQQHGFSDIQIQPFSLNPQTKPGDETDMLVISTKPLPTPASHSPIQQLQQQAQIVKPILHNASSIQEVKTPHQSDEYAKKQTWASSLKTEERTALYGRRYFDAGGGSSADGIFLLDFPHNENVFRKVMSRRPESVLELGCARGYILKKLEDVGVRCAGYDISRHCYLTRATDAVRQQDLIGAPTPIGEHWDLCLTVAFLEHIPEDKLQDLIDFWITTRCKRGLHGIHFSANKYDSTQVTLRPREWWQSKLPPNHEVFDIGELRGGDLPIDYVRGDGKIKCNVGCAFTQFHNGWKNIDVIDAKNFANAFRYDFLQHDVKNGLPYKTQEVHLIYASHFLEHLSYKDGLSFLRECRRVIRPDGVMRIAVPHVGMLLQMYANLGLSNDLRMFDEVNGNCAESPTNAGKLYSLMCENHLALYDTQTLCNALEDANWIAHPTNFRHTECGDVGKQLVREALDTHPTMTLVVEATPKVGSK